jgi:RNA polymerase sigma-70 factor (ECF subfamily)
MTAPGESRAVSSTGPTRGPGSPRADAAAHSLYERYGNRIFRYCLQRLHSVEEAEDAAQTAFLYAFVGLSRGVEPEFEVAWLYKIAENVCCTRIRSRLRRGRYEASGELFELLDVIPAADRTSSEAADALPEILSSMPPSQRRALLLREVQGLSYREIAEQLRTSVSAVETLLFRARRSCARELERIAHPTERMLSAAWLGAGLKSLVSRFFATSSGAKVAVLAAAAATGGALVAAPRLVEHRHVEAPATAQPRPQAPLAAAATPPARRTSPVARRAPLTQHSKTRHAPLVTGTTSDAPQTPAAVREQPTAPVGSEPTPSPSTGSAPPPADQAPSRSAPAEPQPALPQQTLPQLPPVTVPTITVPPLPTVELPPAPALPPLPALPPVQLPALPQLPSLP